MTLRQSMCVQAALVTLQEHEALRSVLVSKECKGQIGVHRAGTQGVQVILPSQQLQKAVHLIQTQQM